MKIQYKEARNKTKWKKDNLLLVIHWAACTGPQCIYWFQCPGNKGSSAHYVIDRNGLITNMVPEKYIAWHAGFSSLKDYPTKIRGQEWKSVNVCSIGIELAGPPTSINKIAEKRGWAMHWDGWPGPEINALIELCIDIKNRWPEIKLTDHSTISPGRKSDVKKGRGIDIFPWNRLLKETGIEEA
jgi:N-acetylmuramoyl-L-alanine amidase